MNFRSYKTVCSKVFKPNRRLHLWLTITIPPIQKIDFIRRSTCNLIVSDRLGSRCLQSDSARTDILLPTLLPFFIIQKLLLTHANFCLYDFLLLLQLGMDRCSLSVDFNEASAKLHNSPHPSRCMHDAHICPQNQQSQMRVKMNTACSIPFSSSVLAPRYSTAY